MWAMPSDLSGCRAWLVCLNPFQGFPPRCQPVSSVLELARRTTPASHSTLDTSESTLDTRPLRMSDELAQLKARYDRLNLLYQVGNVIHSTLDPQEALQLILEEAVRLMRASR